VGARRWVDTVLEVVRTKMTTEQTVNQARSVLAIACLDCGEESFSEFQIEIGAELESLLADPQSHRTGSTLRMMARVNGYAPAEQLARNTIAAWVVGEQSDEREAFAGYLDTCRELGLQGPVAQGAQQLLACTKTPRLERSPHLGLLFAEAANAARLDAECDRWATWVENEAVGAAKASDRVRHLLNLAQLWFRCQRMDSSRRLLLAVLTELERVPAGLNRRDSQGAYRWANLTALIRLFGRASRCRSHIPMICGSA
jgi:hypothetical protein